MLPLVVDIENIAFIELPDIENLISADPFGKDDVFVNIQGFYCQMSINLRISQLPVEGRFFFYIYSIQVDVLGGCIDPGKNQLADNKK